MREGIGGQGGHDDRGGALPGRQERDRWGGDVTERGVERAVPQEGGEEYGDGCQKNLRSRQDRDVGPARGQGLDGHYPHGSEDVCIEEDPDSRGPPLRHRSPAPQGLEGDAEDAQCAPEYPGDGERAVQCPVGAHHGACDADRDDEGAAQVLDAGFLARHQRGPHGRGDGGGVVDDQRRGDGKIGDREHEPQVGAQGRQGRDQEQDGQVPPPHAEVSGGAEAYPDPQGQRGEEAAEEDHGEHVRAALPQEFRGRAAQGPQEARGCGAEDAQSILVHFGTPELCRKDSALPTRNIKIPFNYIPICPRPRQSRA